MSNYRGKRLKIQDVDGDIYVAKKVYDYIFKKLVVTNMSIVSKKLVVEYKTKFGQIGVMELYDIGPNPTKKK